MSDLTIGKVGRRKFTLPPEIATQATAIHGVRGKGKTVTATVIVEELLALGVQVVVIDPTDVWSGLKSSADGKRPGFDIVTLGGPHGDLPLLADHGRTIADFAVDRGVPLILSLRHLRKGDQRRFVTDFAEQLFHRKGAIEHRTPLFLVIDEASQYVPQRVMGDTARMVGAIQDIVRLGRSAGLGCALVDQRPATVNKDVLTQIELLVCHAVTSPQDRKALTEWIRQKDSENRKAAFLEDLASLPRGVAWFWHPIADVFERVHVRMRTTFDSSRTPELGETAVAPEARAEVDLEELRAALEETIAEAEANDPKTLKKRIRELEAELRNSARADDEDEDRALEIVEERDRYVRAALAEQRKTFAAAAAALMKAAGGLRPAIEQLLDGLGEAADELDELLASDDWEEGLIDAGDGTTPRPRSSAPATARATRPRRQPRQAPKPTNGDASLPEGERKILTAAAQYPDGVTREQLSILTAYKRSTRDTYVRRLAARDLVEVAGPLVHATEAGVAALGDFEPLPTGDELRAYWLAELPEGESAVLATIAGSYPASIERSELGEITGYKRSTRDTYIRRLAARKLVQTDGRGAVRASEDLFS